MTDKEIFVEIIIIIFFSISITHLCESHRQQRSMLGGLSGDMGVSSYEYLPVFVCFSKSVCGLIRVSGCVCLFF